MVSVDWLLVSSTMLDTRVPLRKVEVRLRAGNRGAQVGIGVADVDDCRVVAVDLDEGRSGGGRGGAGILRRRDAQARPGWATGRGLVGAAAEGGGGLVAWPMLGHRCSAGNESATDERIEKRKGD
jgi:hypothetical protein